MAHPGGISAGVRAMHQAWEAAMSGTPLDQYAAGNRELREALATFA